MSASLTDCPVLVFGGSGFIGNHLVSRLVSLGARVTVYDRHPPDVNGVAYIQGDFAISEAFDTATRGQRIIFHLVSTTLPASSNQNPHFDIQTNVLSTIDLLQTAVLSKVDKIVFISSGGTIYGIPESVPIKETHQTNPICSYGIGKLAIEKYLQLFNRLHGLEYVILRVSNPYGPGQSSRKGQGVVAEFVTRVQEHKPLEVFGDGSVVRDFIYISDVIEALIAAAVKPVSGVFNVGSGTGVSLRELIDIISNISEDRIIVKYGNKRVFDVQNNVLSIERIQEALGWTPVISLSDGLKKTFGL